MANQLKPRRCKQRQKWLSMAVREGQRARAKQGIGWDRNCLFRFTGTPGERDNSKSRPQKL